jgi:hypothetical protein
LWKLPVKQEQVICSVTALGCVRPFM